MLLLLRFLTFFSKSKKRDFYVFCRVSYVFSNYALPPAQNIFVLCDLKMEHFGAVFKLDLTDAIARGGGSRGGSTRN